MGVLFKSLYIRRARISFIAFIMASALVRAAVHVTLPFMSGKFVTTDDTHFTRIMPTERPQFNKKGAPDYDDPVFWDNKFATGQDVGEWLNTGDAVLEAVLEELNTRHQDNAANPRVLHLGPGISKLGAKLQDASINHGWNGNSIVNVDFSAEAVRLGQEAEKDKDALSAMHWMRADLRSWDDVFQLTQFAPFDVIMDKSTSDSISTSEPLVFPPPKNIVSICPIIQKAMDGQKSTSLSLSPVETLALHLVPLTEVGTTWVALSYSTFRFDNMRVAGQYWKLISRTPLRAPAGELSSSAHTPEIFHWLYILKRI